MIGADLVLANGTAIHVSPTENADLFWSICEAPPSSGIVTQRTMRIRKAPNKVIRYAYKFIDPDRSPEKLANIQHAYQVWGLTAPEEMGMVANVWQGGKVIEMAGYYMGNQDDFDRVTAPLFNATGQPSTTYVQERDWIAVLTEADGGAPLSTKGSPEQHDPFYVVVPTYSPIMTDPPDALGQYFTITPVPGTLPTPGMNASLPSDRSFFCGH
ncbi:hypothetical protein B0H17DRAFT_565018 [Mycena rosella]|uniref:Uncharacterized protein n=1 Tax=Mycena rosella TaxID=1033263 RepID=A0AAD7GEJ7_MYCRO|nr:hypothetical protein B0H17DRAFT_565018 [Mycena rosella]